MALLYVTKSERNTAIAMPNLHSHAIYELYYLARGSRQFFLEDSLYELTAPALVIIPPCAPHKTGGEGFQRYDLYVAPTFLTPFQQALLEKHALECAKPDPEQDRLLVGLLEELEQLPPGPDQEEQLRGIFAYFMIVLSRLHFQPRAQVCATAQKASPSVLKAIAYIQTHYQEKITLAELSQRFFVAKATLNYQFKRAFACSPMEYLLETRITRAKQSLMTTRASVARIAEDCGFPSANYFGLMFKKKVGLSPSAFRRQYGDGTAVWPALR